MAPQLLLSLVLQRDLEMALQRLEEVPHRLAYLEQYSTPADIAADLLWTALYKGDIKGKHVADLGCGNGILGIGAALLGASCVMAVDIDPAAVETARANAVSAGVSLETSVGDVASVEGEYDTVIQNPPFGAQKKHADLPFLVRGIALAPVLYSFHNGETARWVERTVDRLGARTDFSKRYKFPIPFGQPFHKKSVRHFDVVLFRIVRR
jgi:putative methylase